MNRARYPVDVVEDAETVLERLIERDDLETDVYEQIDQECRSTNVFAADLRGEAYELVHELVKAAGGDFTSALQYLQRFPDEDDEGYVWIGECKHLHVDEKEVLRGDVTLYTVMVCEDCGKQLEGANPDD